MGQRRDASRLDPPYAAPKTFSYTLSPFSVQPEENRSRQTVASYRCRKSCVHVGEAAVADEPIARLAGRTWRSRLGYAALAFGVWDIFYYVFLKVICGWPHSLLDWDILFLLPLPWWGPVLAPVSIALLMILWGTLASGWDIELYRKSGEWKVWLLNFIGVALALASLRRDTAATRVGYPARGRDRRRRPGGR